MALLSASQRSEAFNTKGLILAALSLLALVLLWPALATPAVRTGKITTSRLIGNVTVTTDVEATVDAFWTCSRTQVAGGEIITTCTDAKDVCPERESVRKAFGGFGVLMVICVGLSSVFAVAKAFADQINQGVAKFIYLGIVIASLVFGLISWAAAFAFGSSEYCGSRYVGGAAGYVTGPAGPLILVSFIAVAAQLVLEFVFAAGAAAAASSSSVGGSTGADAAAAAAAPAPAAVVAANEDAGNVVA